MVFDFFEHKTPKRATFHRDSSSLSWGYTLRNTPRRYEKPAGQREIRTEFGLMLSRTLLQQARLYGILDLGYVQPSAIAQVTKALCVGGVDLLQLRAKGKSPTHIERWAGEMLPITRSYNVPLIINDHPEVAAKVGCEGVHVGQEDDSIARAREWVGPDVWIGKSTHSLSQALAAQEEGPDYIGFGPLYATGTKPDYTPVGLADVPAVHAQIRLPIFCIGGVNLTRIQEIVQAGACRVVAVSALLLATKIEDETRRLKAALP